MANRIGLELLPDTCRVVEVQPSTGWFGRKRAGDGPSRVKAFYEIPYSPDHPGACAAELRRLLGSRGRDLRLAMWGLRSTHQVFNLPQASVADLEMMARREARARSSGSATAAAAATADGVMAGEHVDGGRREVGYVSVSPAELQGRVQAFESAGLGITSVTTPAVAHMKLVRQRWGQFGDAATAVLSVNARATAMTVVRGGVVLFSREMPWGHQTERTAGFDATAFAGQLASELRRSLVFLKQQTKVDVGHVLVCGDLPDLRALTGPLMHELNVEVETLDALEGFDVAHLPEPADEFRARIGALRTAWILAAEASPALNLQPREARTVRVTPSFDPQARTRLIAAALAGVVIAGIAWGGAEYLVRRSRTRVQDLQRQVNTLGPEVQRQEANRQTMALIGARGAALEAFATQGPRLAAVLAAFASGAPGEVVINTMTVAPGVGTWRITVNGQALAETPALAQAVFNQFLRGATSSPLIGAPVRPPTINVETHEPVAVQADAGAGAGGGASLMTPRDEVAALERPRNVILSESWEALTPQERQTAELLGRRPQRVMVEPHWHLHPGGVPKAISEGIAAYNAEQSSWEQLVLKGTGRSLVATAAPRTAPSMLDFSVEFEVRK
jgi:hypothetical protein